MERYETYSAIPVKCIRLYLRDYRDSSNVKAFDVHQEDLVSILYIDNLNDVGEGKEYQIDCRIIDIKYNPKHTRREELNIPIQHSIINISKAEFTVDCGDKRKSKIRILNADNILNIEKYPHKFDLCENPKLVPTMTEGFVINELKTPQQIDTGLDPYPLSKLNGEIFGKES